jgi:outer membrane protein OmpA-like peptidoglycan-associated protein
LVNTDLLDGKRYTGVSNSIFNTTDFDNYGFTSLGINFRLGKGQESLWWTNPVSDVYEQVADASKRMKDATTDTDGDGIADVFDKEPNTPAGATVDSKGVTIDSDKDGVPDYLDKEPFSAPGATVDNAGRAVPKNYTQDGPHDPNDLNDPFNPNSNFYKGAMAALGGAKPNGGGNNWFLPIIHFDLDRSNIKPEYFPELLQVATVLRNNPSMKLVVTGHTDIRASESYNMGLSQRRADAAIDHLVRKYNIDRSRLQVEAKGETTVLVTGLPDSYVPSKERAQGVNRRVEFRVAGTNAVLGTK